MNELIEKDTLADEIVIDIYNEPIVAINKYLTEIDSILKKWSTGGIDKPWFRGQADTNKDIQCKLLPSILRNKYDEFWMTTTFRNRAPMFGKTPTRDEMDKWLFLMQHVGLPTRLLDWMESPLMALYFAVDSAISNKTQAVIWMINPKALNYHSIFNRDLSPDELGKEPAYFPNTWKDTGPGIGNIRLAFREINKKNVEPGCDFCNCRKKGSKTWLYEEFNHKTDKQEKNESRYKFSSNEKDDAKKLFKIQNKCKDKEYLCPKCRATKKPIAIQLTYCHPKMSAQKGCFTVHGTEKEPIDEMSSSNNFYKNGYLIKIIFQINPKKLFEKIVNMGITESVIYPDLNGLAKELKERFWLI